MVLAEVAESLAEVTIVVPRHVSWYGVVKAGQVPAALEHEWNLFEFPVNSPTPECALVLVDAAHQMRLWVIPAEPGIVEPHLRLPGVEAGDAALLPGVDQMAEIAVDIHEEDVHARAAERLGEPRIARPEISAKWLWAQHRRGLVAQVLPWAKEVDAHIFQGLYVEPDPEVEEHLEHVFDQIRVVVQGIGKILQAQELA